MTFSPVVSNVTKTTSILSLPLVVCDTVSVVPTWSPNEETASNATAIAFLDYVTEERPSPRVHHSLALLDHDCLEHPILQDFGQAQNRVEDHPISVSF